MLSLDSVRLCMEERRRGKEEYRGTNELNKRNWKKTALFTRSADDFPVFISTVQKLNAHRIDSHTIRKQRIVRVNLMVNREIFAEF